jgi:hypothetical protein
MPRGDRTTAAIAAAVVGSLVVAAVLFGVSASSANPRLADVGAWLWSKTKGTVVHANGLSGDVDGLIDIAASKKLKIVQDGTSVLLVDEATGVVSRVEPSQINVTQTRDFQAAGLQLVVSGNLAYAVDPAGTVQRIDPATLNAVGTPVKLQGPLGRSGIDGGGRLWVPVPARGEVVPIAEGVPQEAVKVGRAGEELSLTIAGSVPMIVNTRAATAVVIGSDGSTGKVVLPPEVAAASQGGVLAPARTDGPKVPVLVPGPSGLLVVVDTDSNAPSHVKLADKVDPRGLGVPQILGSRVYIPDSGTGRLIVWDAAAEKVESPIAIAETPGPLDVFVKDGLLWANDENGDRALVIDADGRERPVEKDDSNVPGPTRTPKPRPTPKPQPTDTAKPPVADPTETAGDDEVAPEETPTPSKTPQETSTPTPTATPTPTPSAPAAPGSVSVRSGPGKIDVTFSPSSGGKVDHYSLKVSGSGGNAKPDQVRADGPFQFEFSGGDCGTDYSFTVVAHWAGGQVESQASAGARPCVAPGAPSGFQAKAKNKGADLSWSPPENASDSTVTYVLSGAASNNGIEGTSFSVGNLKNNVKHEFALKAKNAAGESQSTATASVDLAYPRQQYQNQYNNQTNTIIRGQTPKNGGEIGRIPQGQYISITVICQLKGESVREAESGETSDVWNRIEWNGGVGYLSETLMRTPRGSFPAAPLFQCDD